MPDLASEPVDETLDAVSLLRASRVVAAIGPLTNVAEALESSHAIEQLVVMGGDLRPDEPEHNLRCDVAAAQAVFAAGVPALVTGIDQTERVVLTDLQLAAIESSGPLGRQLDAEIRQFRTWLGRPDSPHDAVAVLAYLRPDLCTFATGWIEVSAEGRTTLRRDDGGPHRMVVDLDAEAVAQEIVTRTCRAGAR
jgi:purine nucleosidase